MVEFITGVPGSGKSYRGIFSLYTNFGKDKQKINYKSLLHKDVNHAYTNINEIQLDQFDDDKVKPLDWDEFYEHLTQLHGMYKAKATDSEMLPIAKELGLKNVLIILDECHNYLDKQNAVIIWWLSYHRHFHQQIYLITQNLSLVHSKYKAFSEFFYEARPSSLKLFKNSMVYFQYTSSRLSQKSKSGKISIPVVNEVFSSYGSGANQQSSSVIKKFIFIAVIFFLLLVIGVFSVKQYFLSKSENIEETQDIKSEQNVELNNQTTSYKKSNHLTKELQPYTIYCLPKECLIEGEFYSYEYMKFLFEVYEMRLVAANTINISRYRKFHLFISPENYKKLFTIRSKEYEKNNTNKPSLPSIF